jgi:UDP-glucose 4-epimerase
MPGALNSVAVTGAKGMLGRHVEAALARAGIRCVPVDRTRWDLRRWASDDELDAIFSHCDAVVHAGAAVPSPGRPVPAQDILDANVRACFCLGDWARRRGKPIVLVSGATVYATGGTRAIKEDDATTSRPDSGLYGLSKLLADQLLDSLAAQGLKLCILRPSSIYGAGMPETRMVAAMLAKARRGEDLRLLPPVRDRVSLVHAADVADATLRALKKEAWGVFNVGGPDAASIADIANACVAVAGRGKVIAPADDASEGSLKYALDSSKAAAAFGYSPRIGLEEGLRRTMAGEL